jgi:hypothetical protein
MNFKKIISGFLGFIGLACIVFSYLWNLSWHHDLSVFCIVTAIGILIIAIAILVYLVYTLRDDSKRRDEYLDGEIKKLKVDVDYVEDKALEHIEGENEQNEEPERKEEKA